MTFVFSPFNFITDILYAVNFSLSTSLSQNSYYCKQSFLNNNTQIRSIQPTKRPPKVTMIQMRSLNKENFFKRVDHLTTISVIQLTTGMSSNKICTRRLCLLNQVITFFSFIFDDFIISHITHMSNTVEKNFLSKFNF